MFFFYAEQCIWTSLYSNFSSVYDRIKYMSMKELQYTWNKMRKSIHLFVMHGWCLVFLDERFLSKCKLDLLNTNLILFDLILDINNCDNGSFTFISFSVEYRWSFFEMKSMGLIMFLQLRIIFSDSQSFNFLKAIVYQLTSFML